MTEQSWTIEFTTPRGATGATGHPSCSPLECAPVTDISQWRRRGAHREFPLVWVWPDDGTQFFHRIAHCCFLTHNG